MPKLIMMSGLPASGKSTLAKQMMVAMGASNVVRLNKDLLRTMLHFDKFTPMNEGLTQDAQKTLARFFLGKKKNVIIDDTNLGDFHKDSWQTIAKECGADFVHKIVECSVEECLRRDAEREKRVGSHVIVGMAMQYGLMPKPEKPYVLCDLDGTLCDIRHRLHYVKQPATLGTSDEKGAEMPFKKDWKGFFAAIPLDTMRDEVALKLRELHFIGGHPIIFVSARPDTYRKETEEWLEKNISIDYLALLMRRGGDSRPDTDVKKQILDTYFKDKSQIACVIDDRPSVIRMWRENGLEVIDVGSGVEF